MKKLLTLLFVTSIFSVYAQDVKPALSDLYISNAPGLMLAGKSTATVDKPATPRAFALSLVNLGQGGAVEITPYWWFERPNLTYEKYIQKKFVLMQTLNFSVANYKSDDLFTVAPGIRAEVIRSYSKKSTAAIIAKYRAWQKAFAVLDLKTCEGIKKQLDSLTLKSQISVDIAGAILGTSSASPFKDLDFNKTGVWTNIGWNPAAFPLGFVGLARYSWGNDKKPTPNTVSKYLDFGVQTNYTTTKYIVAAEYVNSRDYSAGQNYSKLTASLSYVITDNIQLVASYGKDLKPGNGTVALFGLNFGLERSK